jgi:hypothetical protein
MNTIKKTVLAFGISIMVGGSLFAVMVPSSTFAATLTSSSTEADCSQNFLTFPTWFRGLVEVKQAPSGVYECTITPPKSGDLSAFIWHIVLNVIEIGMQIAAYLTLGLILWGGFGFLTSEGKPDATAKSRQTIINAAVGLAISIAAIAVVNLISGIIIYNP